LRDRKQASISTFDGHAPGEPIGIGFRDPAARRRALEMLLPG